MDWAASLSRPKILVWHVMGNYNSNAGDPFWANPGTVADINHAAAAVIADSVTLLSNGWSGHCQHAKPGQPCRPDCHHYLLSSGDRGGKEYELPATCDEQ